MAIGVAAFAVALAIAAWYPALRLRIAGWPMWLLAVVDLVVISAPLVVAVVVTSTAAARIRGAGRGGAVGGRRGSGVSWGDVVAGAGLGLVLRALVELLAPTTGGGAFDPEITPSYIAAVAVTIVGIVVVSPVVEETFFRGLLQRALQQLIPGRRGVSAVIAIAVATIAFVALHAVPFGFGMPLGLLLGTAALSIGCGTLTAVTGRLAGAIAAHVVFNLLGVVAALAV